MADAPETLNDLRRDLKRALTVMAERAPDYILGRDFYNGTRVEIAASKYVRKIITENADAMPISLAHIPVDVIVDMVEFTSLDVADAESARQLAAVVAANDVADGAEDWLRKAAYFGDYYAIVDPLAEDGAGNIVPDSIKWIGSSPLTTVRIYDRADDRTPLYGAKAWLDGKTWRARLYYDDSTVKLISDKSSALEAKSFELDYEQEAADAYIFHEGSRMLVEHLAIDGKPYGVALHHKAWGPQDAITKISATNMANLEALGLPARYALLDPMAELDDDIDADYGTDGPGVTADRADGLTTPTNGSKVRSVPGGISFLRGIKSVGTFESGDGGVFIPNLDWYVRAMAVATGIPLFEFDLKGDQPSGESRRRAMMRALKKAKRVRRAMGGFIEGLAETTLAVLGRGEQVVTAMFYPIEASTDKEGLELVGLKISNGVPVRTALLEAGYTDEQVGAWYPDAAPAVTPGLLTVLATALVQLGTAQTLGVISEAEVAEMLPAILTGARGEGPRADPGIVTNPAEIIKTKADAMGALVRAGADQAEAAIAVGLDGITFPNVPTAVRIPEVNAVGLEGAPAGPPAGP